MDAGVQLGILLALATAAGSVVGFLYKHRGAVESPPVDWSRPVRSTLVLFRSRWYLLGCVIATTSWGFHVAALAVAPISVVQSVIAGGLVLLTVIADRMFGLTVTRRDWIGVALAALGLAFLAATLEGTAGDAHASHTTEGLAAFVVLATAAAAAVGASSRRALRPGLPLAVAAGLLWAGSDVAIKAASDRLDDLGWLAAVQPLSLVVLVLSIAGLLVSAASLQAGPPVAVIACTSVAANVTTIAAGPIVFGDPLPEDTVGLAVRLLAFALVIVAAALTPGPAPDRVAAPRG
jgi:drug/metabolite transporter (DMT)-like permease